MGRHHGGFLVAAEYKRMVEATAVDRDIWNYWRGQRPMRAVAPLKKNGSHVSDSVGGSHCKPWLHHQFVAAKLFYGTRSKASTISIWWRNILYNSRHHCFTEFNKQVAESLWEHLAAVAGFCACVTNVPIGVPGFLCRIFPCSNLHIWRPSLSMRKTRRKPYRNETRSTHESVTQNRASNNTMSILFTPAYITL